MVESGSTQSTAVKVYWPERRAAFETEVLCYQRLAERNVTQILGFAIPRMVAFDASLLVVEMDFVSRPSLLDFGKAKLDTPPQDDFSDVEAVQVDMQEKWGSKLPLVRKIVWHLQTLGIYYLRSPARKHQFRR